MNSLIAISILASIGLSVVAMLLTYSICCKEPFIVDAAFVYRGWPLHWAVESWSWWSPEAYSHKLNFDMPNFLVDLGFWMMLFQFPSILLALLGRNLKKHVNTRQVREKREN